MQLTVENTRLVYMGDRNENLTWGFVQFPRLYPMRNGNIGIDVHLDYDSQFAEGSTCLVSADEGASWRAASKRECDMMGTLLPNGDVIRPIQTAPHPLTGLSLSRRHYANYHIPSDCLTPQISDEEGALPFPLTHYTDIDYNLYHVYRLDSMRDEWVEKRLCFHRLKEGKDEAEQFFASVDWPHRTVSVLRSFEADGKTPRYTALTAGLYACRTVKVAPDGSLYIAHYRKDTIDPYTGAYHGMGECFILRSTDNGESWHLHGYIPYEPDEARDPFARLENGFYEPCIEWMPDGSMLVILRTCEVMRGAPEWGPTYLARSTDGGKTWSKPEYFKDRGALPLLLHLECGVTLAVITRPGIFVYASTDCGRTWDACLQIMEESDRSHLANDPPARPTFHQWAGSCCNCSILPLDSHRALLAYSDFYAPDEKGVKRKAIKTATIVVK